MGPSFVNNPDVEEFGYTPAVITMLGVSGLKGIGFSSVRNIGAPHKFWELLSAGDLQEFVSKVNTSGAKFVPEQAGADNWQALKTRVWRDGREKATALAGQGIRCIALDSEIYPRSFLDLGRDQPYWIFARGDVSLLSASSVAVVGTRNPSIEGDFLTKFSVTALRTLDTPVVSGLAIGIDSIAHEWALRLNLPTISVLGSGLLVPYPARNADLADDIVKRGGLLISEYFPSQPPTAQSFVWRNRLQAALSTCVIASEWKRSSGTAHTVRFAQKMRRGNISLSVSGIEPPSDAGRGDNHFSVPSDQAEFLAHIQRGGQARPDLKSFQPSLF